MNSFSLTLIGYRGIKGAVPFVHAFYTVSDGTGFKNIMESLMARTTAILRLLIVTVLLPVFTLTACGASDTEPVKVNSVPAVDTDLLVQLIERPIRVTPDSEVTFGIWLTRSTSYSPGGTIKLSFRVKAQEPMTIIAPSDSPIIDVKVILITPSSDVWEDSFPKSEEGYVVWSLSDTVISTLPDVLRLSESDVPNTSPWTEILYVEIPHDEIPTFDRIQRGWNPPVLGLRVDFLSEPVEAYEHSEEFKRIFYTLSRRQMIN